MESLRPFGSGCPSQVRPRNEMKVLACKKRPHASEAILIGAEVLLMLSGGVPYRDLLLVLVLDSEPHLADQSSVRAKLDDSHSGALPVCRGSQVAARL
jgi:hypothetical protein